LSERNFAGSYQSDEWGFYSGGVEKVAEMTSAELIRMFVLNSFCDDYEDIEQITKRTDELGLACGLTISREDIILALRELIELGYAKAWDLTRWATTEDQGMPPREEITPMNPRFVRTEEGLAFYEASSTSGPFDEDHNLRESWPAPEASLRRGELVRLFILGSYGNCTHVHLATIEMLWNRRYQIRISREEFIQALKELIGLGHLKAAYRDEYWQYDGMPPLEDIKPFGAYFWVTGDGSDFHSAARPWWPFDEDDDGEFILRKDWAPPEA
jgi:hypothetical protein